MVVQVPEKDPAKKALTTGLASKSILNSLLLRLLTLRLKFVKAVAAFALFVSIRELITESRMVEENQKVFGHENLADDGVGLDVGHEAGLEREAGFGLKRKLEKHLSHRPAALPKT